MGARILSGPIQSSSIDSVGPFPLAMACSEGTGLPLVSLGGFGADLIHFEPVTGTDTHTHPGDHILVVLAGEGWVQSGDTRLILQRSTIYLVPGGTPHRVTAGNDSSLTLLSIANKHIPVNDTNRSITSD